MDCMRQQRRAACACAHGHIMQIKWNTPATSNVKPATSAFRQVHKKIQYTPVVLTLVLTHHNRAITWRKACNPRQVLQHRCTHNKKFFQYRSTYTAAEHTAQMSTHPQRPRKSGTNACTANCRQHWPPRAED
jgi:hypothetical protein